MRACASRPAWRAGRGADVSRQLDRIELEAERLDTLIGQMLQLSHLRAVPTLPREPLDLTSLLSEIVEDARLEASAAEKTVDWIARRSMIVEGDHGSAAQRDRERAAQCGALHQAVLGGDACVRIAPDRRSSIVIDDRGPGVPEAELQRIFEPFYRVAESRDRDSGGTGLGLAITARIVSLYGGDVQARNTPGRPARRDRAARAGVSLTAQ